MSLDLGVHYFDEKEKKCWQIYMYSCNKSILSPTLSLITRPLQIFVWGTIIQLMFALYKSRFGSHYVIFFFFWWNTVSLEQSAAISMIRVKPNKIHLVCVRTQGGKPTLHNLEREFTTEEQYTLWGLLQDLEQCLLTNLRLQLTSSARIIQAPQVTM